MCNGSTFPRLNSLYNSVVLLLEREHPKNSSGMAPVISGVRIPPLRMCVASTRTGV